MVICMQSIYCTVYIPTYDCWSFLINYRYVACKNTLLLFNRSDYFKVKIFAKLDLLMQSCEMPQCSEDPTGNCSAKKVWSWCGLVFL